MRIRIKQSGAEMAIENSAGAALVAPGLAERIESDDRRVKLPRPADFKPLEPKWKVLAVDSLEGLRFLAIEFRIGNHRAVYFGDPKLVNAKLRTPLGGESFQSGLGRPCPPQVCESYTNAWAANPELRGTDVRDRASYGSSN